ncbi:alpha/beta hydrolase [Streptomyces sp. NPDC005794]|uniref:alpha/beta hydrolase n=1 Tax=Streptomyces sp. NPDC005794 TaxID=3364733 RepID=UPI0036AE27BB
MLTTTCDLAHGVLSARPATPLRAPLAAGLHWLDTPTNPALLYVPDRLPYRPAPLLVALHGANGVPGDMLALLRPAAAPHGALVLAPASEQCTWDTVTGGRFGKDAVGLEHAMATVFDHFHVDADRIAISGFSDGASYALGVGLANGDLFTRILAYSPGQVPPVRRHGRPTIFVSHGRHDVVQPIARTSHRIVPALEDDGYHVDFIEHTLGHQVPDTVVTASAELLG